MGKAFENWGWRTISANDALTGTTYEVSYQSFTGKFRVNGVSVERTREFETAGEETASTLTLQGKGIIAHLKISDLQRLLQ